MPIDHAWMSIQDQDLIMQIILKKEVCEFNLSNS